MRWNLDINFSRCMLGVYFDADDDAIAFYFLFFVLVFYRGPIVDSRGQE